ncbi:MAG TPA: sigma 54-interacting transcriptional regulator [Gammaproteobacteria bacterium]|nr:sigma 54-interacting transcriptional regulator [Gammaproteobacteria bacterium]
MVTAGQAEHVHGREVLLLASDEVPGLSVPALRTWGWNVSRAVDAATADRLIQARSYHTGLVLVEGTAPEDLLRLEELLTADAHMEWVALVRPQQLESEPVCRLLSELTFDYLTLPVDEERLLFTVGHAYGKCQLARRTQGRWRELGDHQMIGQSPPMEALYQSLEKVARDDAPVLITGESGTGKEAAARAIHRMSMRRDGPFAAVNCGALPGHLVQTELFGHEKGAFTGAYARKIGRFEFAEGGIVFLDEIGDLAPDLQVNLLRFLQDKCIERVGSNNQIPVDVRVIAATHVDLERAVHERRFREDLYYRLNVLHVKIPPLREREGDIELLARAYLEKFARERKSRVHGLSQQALRAMDRHPWPGNVRELINRIQRAVVMSDRRLLTAADLGLDSGGPWEGTTLPGVREKAEEQLIHHTLRLTRGNISETARQLGVSRSTVYRLLKKIEPI